jgi:transcriptional regulator with XRE-family HTH domain
MKRPRARLQERVAEVIRRYREAGEWTQDAFAAHIEMHRAQYSIMEEGRKDVRLSTLERVAKGLQVPMWVILREAEEPNSHKA